MDPKKLGVVKLRLIIQSLGKSGHEALIQQQMESWKGFKPQPFKDQDPSPEWLNPQQTALVSNTGLCTQRFQFPLVSDDGKRTQCSLPINENCFCESRTLLCSQGTEAAAQGLFLMCSCCPETSESFFSLGSMEGAVRKWPLLSVLVRGEQVGDTPGTQKPTPNQ